MKEFACKDIEEYNHIILRCETRGFDLVNCRFGNNSYFQDVDDLTSKIIKCGYKPNFNNISTEKYYKGGETRFDNTIFEKVQKNNENHKKPLVVNRNSPLFMS